MLEKSTRSIGDFQASHVCTACGKRYKWLDSLKRHIRVDCGNKEKQFSCHVCHRKFRYRYELRNHIVLSYGMSSGFQSYSSAPQHQQDAEPSRSSDGILLNICFGCGRRYKWRDSLLRHQRVECGNKEKKFCCTLCPKKFYHQPELLARCSDQLVLSVPNTVPENGSGESDGGERDRPEQEPSRGTGLGELAEQAGRLGEDVREDIERGFGESHGVWRSRLVGVLVPAVRKRLLWKALKDLEDGPPFLCPKCGRTYTHKCNLTRHLRLECGVGPRFQCAWCKKRFKHRHHLRDHQRIHLYNNCNFKSRN
ncbi:zinc finger protein 425-like [Hylaeus volcanicus]|uniref:zinc finger protein 425-like n=1 Tax=Hylaeus volcanicus TaxID=313075 RepID=UPI0023B81F87|nr:zinc finger protein 425-like [Hylaeus volcanicus]